MRILTIGLSAAATFVVAFLMALHIHFPSQVARDRVAWQVQQATGGAWMLQASDAHLYRGTGLALDDVVLLRRAVRMGMRRANGDGSEGVPATPVLRADRAAARLRMLPLLRGNKSVAYALDLYGGDLSGDLTVGDTTQRLRISGSDIDLSKIPLEGDQWTIDADGTLSIDGDLTLDTDDVRNSEGAILMNIDQLVLKSATVMGMSLSPTPFSEATIGFEIQQGKAEVTKGHFASDPVEVTVEGDVTLNKVLAHSRLKLDLKVKFNDQFDRLARMAPALVDARDEDGLYHFKVTGTLDNPRFRADRVTPPRPHGTSALRPPSLPGNQNANAMAPDRGIVIGSDDAEARRAARQQRIAERRQRMLERQDGGGGPGIPAPGMPPLPSDINARGMHPGLPRPMNDPRFPQGQDQADPDLPPLPRINDPYGPQQQDMQDPGMYDDQGGQPIDDQGQPIDDQGQPIDDQGDY